MYPQMVSKLYSLASASAALARYFPFLESLQNARWTTVAPTLAILIGILRLTLQRRSAKQNKSSRTVSIASILQTSKGHAGETEDDDDRASPSPAYLATSADDDEYIGGDPLHLASPPRGPRGVAVTFRVFAPPSLDKEIPKVDLYGVVNFVRTGTVRTFVPRGSLRLLVIDFRERTLAVYRPRQRKKKQPKRNKRSAKDGNETLFAHETKNNKAPVPPLKKSSTKRKGHKRRRSSGILLSRTNSEHLRNEEEEEDETILEQLDEDSWNPRNFEPAPVALHNLNDLISISAVPPRHGGVIEIISRLVRSKTKTPKKKTKHHPESNKDGGGSLDGKKTKDVKGFKQKKLQGGTKTKQTPQKKEVVQNPSAVKENISSSIKAGKLECQAVAGNDIEGKCNNNYMQLSYSSIPSPPSKEKEERVLQTNDDDNGHNIDPSSSATTTIIEEDHRDEFAFRNPRDAAEFQRIMMVLRTVGREISFLYETLEAMPPPPENVVSDGLADVTEAAEETTAATSNDFVAPGVALDDAWHCLKNMPALRRGLFQYKLLSQSKDNTNDGIFHSSTKAANRLNAADHKMLLEEEWSRDNYHGSPTKKTKLGIVDFVRLFVPPLSKNDSHAAPCFTPCAKSDSHGVVRDHDWMLTSGIEWHYQRLCFVSALQRRVSRAALYVRVYVSARAILREGWHLHRREKKSDDDIPSSSAGKSSSEEVTTNDGDNSNNAVNGKDPISNGRVPMANVETEVGAGAPRAEDPNPVTISDSSLWSPPIVNSHIQGYLCVGWYAFRIQTRSPDCDPIESVPNLRAMVEKYPHHHFFVLSCFIEQLDIVIYFLLVRTLPVGVDRAFDDTVQNFVQSDANGRNKRLGVSLQLGPGDDSSLLTKLTFRTAILALCRDLNRVRKKISKRKRGQSEVILLSELLRRNFMSLQHFGGSLRKGNDLPANYIAISSKVHLDYMPSRIGRKVIGRFVVDFMFAFKVLSRDIIPERPIMTFGMMSIDLQSITNAQVFKESNGGADRRRSTLLFTASSSRRIMKNIARASKFLRGTKQLQSIDADDDTSLANAMADVAHDTDEKNSDYIDTVQEILDGMTVPIRNRSQTRGEHNQDNQVEIIMDKNVQFQISRSEIERYLISCDRNLKATVVRLIESVAWRSVMFPIDLRSCRIEMQSAQFFQQGFDKERNPIFYFRSMLLGPWRNDIQATILTVLHRLETYFLKVDSERPSVKITMIAIMRNLTEIEPKTSKNDNNQGGQEDEQSIRAPNPSSVGSDPRIDSSEEYHNHSNFVFLQLFDELISRHYPGRIAKAFVVPRKDRTMRFRTNFPTHLAQAPVIVLSSKNDLRKYVDKDELVVFAGGKAKISPSAFECGGLE